MTVITLPYRTSLSAGQPERVNHILADLDAIVAGVNGQLDNANVSPTAGIQVTKFAIAGTPDKTKYLRGDATWAIPAGGALKTIENKTLAVDANLEFSNIPLTFKHLMIIGYFRTNRPAQNQCDMYVAVNDDNANSQYDAYTWQAQNSVTPTRTATEYFLRDTVILNNVMGGATTPAGVYANFTMWLPNYSDTSTNKSFIYIGTTNRTGTGGQFLVHHAAGWWRNNFAITKIAFSVQGGLLAAGSRAQLLGMT